MSKKLSEMTLDELWHLFPISLTEHQEQWNKWYQEEEKRLYGILPIKEARINHIGSTAIKEIWAKPIIDILVELPTDSFINKVKEVLLLNGYICMSEEENKISFNMGYTEDGFAEKVYHLHLRYAGDNDEIHFRDYMNDNPVLAKEYEKMKLCLWKKYEYNRDAYTKAKGKFIVECTNQGKKQSKNR